MATSTKKLPTPKYLSTRYVSAEGCFLCDNLPNQDGYIRTRCMVEQRSVMLHVYEWEKVNGKKPEGMELNHKCSNRSCCNLEHLELICGSAHATLTNVNRVGYTMERKTDDQVSEMYRRIKYGGEYINQLCKEFNFKRSTLSSIMNKRSRCGVTDLVDKEFN